MAAQDLFSTHLESLIAPATSAAAITPNDDNELSYVSRSLWVGVAGSLKVQMRDGQDVTFANVTVGWHHLRVRKVFATGTSASSIVSVW